MALSIDQTFGYQNLEKLWKNDPSSSAHIWVCGGSLLQVEDISQLPKKSDFETLNSNDEKEKNFEIIPLGIWYFFLNIIVIVIPLINPNHCHY